MKTVDPWGVHVPFLLLGSAYFVAGGVSLIVDPGFHGHFMLLGAYTVYAGMLLRLFFPAKKYVFFQSLTLALLLLYPFPWLAFLSLSAVEVWGLMDVRSYGGRFPVNLLVLSSPFLSAVSWLLFTGSDFPILVVPLLSYLLGVNEGIFSATLGLKPKFGVLQLPILALVLLYPLSRAFLPVIVAVYFVWLAHGTKRVVRNLSALSVLSSSLVTALSSYFLGEEIHAFALGLMIPFFYSCITYSTSRHNYGKVYVPVTLSTLSYFTRFVDLGFSAILLAVSALVFLYLVRGNLNATTVKNGVSRRTA
ncbi:hypothetical protein [Sulfuracidifex tepidarius]|uniref:Uncharacterized protein n=1 Tax=Sulfuracidifex tepidarius TaxID=1294262 RepID=A0A510E0Q5_9CREN|nr:hypothetical protein [Sulfuracidifex tepidarius]BBG26083.1 hypothetical protein IC007_0588 [Sulfuracidifex tepidarius]